MKESVKIDKAIVAKVRKQAKKNRQTIGGFFEIAAEQLLSDYQRLDASEKLAKKPK